jgi:hypothetical protein
VYFFAIERVALVWSEGCDKDITELLIEPVIVLGFEKENNHYVN